MLRRRLTLTLTPLAMSLAWSAHANPVVEILPAAQVEAELARGLEFSLGELRQIPEEQWDAYAEMVARSWGAHHKTIAQQKVRKRESLLLNKLVIQVVNFARDVSKQSADFENGFRAQFMHAIDARAPGFAWVVVAERVGFDAGAIEGYREGGGVGVQIPVLGTKNLWVQNGEAQLALRLMPLAGNIESLKIGPKDGKRLASPENGLVIRPTAELEATFKTHGVQPGVRFLIQPRVLDPDEVRMVAEVYANITVYGDNRTAVSRINIVPRCIMDFSTDRQRARGDLSHIFQLGYDLLNSNGACSLSAEFALGY